MELGWFVASGYEAVAREPLSWGVSGRGRVGEGAGSISSLGVIGPFAWASSSLGFAYKALKTLNPNL